MGVNYKMILRGNSDHGQVRLYVNISGKRIERNTGVYCKVDDWDKNKQLVKRTDDESGAKNLVVKAVQARATKFFTDMHLQGITPILDDFIQWWDNDSIGGDLHEVLNEIFDEVSYGLTRGTIMNLQSTMKTIREFKPAINYLNLNEGLLREFDLWLMKAKGMKINSRKELMMRFGRMVRVACKTYKDMPNPFETFKMSVERVKRHSLTKDQLVQLWELYFDPKVKGKLHITLGWYLLCCFTGLRMMDAGRLKLEDIDKDGFISVVPEKTKKHRIVVEIPVDNKVEFLLKAIKGKSYIELLSKGYQVKLAHEIGVLIELPWKLHFHSARHTYAMLFLESGGQVHVLSKLLGHSKIETTMMYVDVNKEAKRKQVESFNKMLGI